MTVKMVEADGAFKVFADDEECGSFPTREEAEELYTRMEKDEGDYALVKREYAALIERMMRETSRSRQTVCDWLDLMILELEKGLPCRRQHHVGCPGCGCECHSGSVLDRPSKIEMEEIYEDEVAYEKELERRKAGG